MTEFDIVPELEAGPIRRTGRRRRDVSPLVAAIMEGAMVFVPGLGGSAQSRFQTLKKRGYRVYGRQRSRDGVEGMYVWAVKDDDAET